MEVIKQECKSIVDILEQDSAEGNFKALIKVYIPRSTGVANEDKPYLDWMEALIHDLLTGRPMSRTVSKQSQTSGQILATTYSRLYSKPTNEERSRVTGYSNPERNSKKHSLMTRSQLMTTTERLLTLMSQFTGVERPLTPSV